jgi:hypothetical protein
MVQHRAARFVTKRQQNKYSVADMFSWCGLADRSKDGQLVVVYSIVNENVAITKEKT